MFHQATTPSHSERASTAIRGGGGSSGGGRDTGTEYGRSQSLEPSKSSSPPPYRLHYHRGERSEDETPRRLAPFLHHTYRTGRSSSPNYYYHQDNSVSTYPLHPVYVPRPSTAFPFSAFSSRRRTMSSEYATTPSHPLRLRPNSLYLIISTRKTPAVTDDMSTLRLDVDSANENIGNISSSTIRSETPSKPRTFSDPEPSTTTLEDEEDRLRWGLYWCRSHGLGRSYRYCLRGDTWRFEQSWHPSAWKTENQPIEENEHVVVAMHIENMEETMANLLGERLHHNLFAHSAAEKRKKTRSMSEGDVEREIVDQPQPNEQGRNDERPASTLGNRDFEREENKSRKWVGHALVHLNDMGFVGLKHGSYSAGLIEREALEKVKRNMGKTPRSRTVERSDNVIYDTNAASGSG